MSVPPDDGAQPTGTGDCYKSAFDLFMGLAEGPREMRLCHGRVYHPTPGWHGHAWVEFVDGDVYDFSNGIDGFYPRDVYYRSMSASSVVRYTAEEARAHGDRTGTYGPWGES